MSRRGILAAVALVVGLGAVGGFLAGRTGGGLPGGFDLRSLAVLHVHLADGDATTAAGVVIASSGFVLTAADVVTPAARIDVGLGSASALYTAFLIDFDPTDDVAFLQLQGAASLTPAAVAPGGPFTGDQVTVVTPTRVPGALTTGLVRITATGQSASATDISLGVAGELQGLVTFTSESVPPVSGAPLLDADGRLAGITSATSGTDSTSYAEPMSAIRDVVTAVERGQTSPRLLHGSGIVIGTDVKDAASPAGALVTGVRPVSPAQAAGIESGDVIVRVDSTPVTSAAALLNVLQQHPPGQIVSVEWVTPAGQKRDANVQLVSGTLT